MSDVSREIRQAERLRGSGKRKVKGDVLAIQSVARRAFNLDSALNKNSNVKPSRRRNHTEKSSSISLPPPRKDDPKSHRYPLKRSPQETRPRQTALSNDSPLLPASAREQLTRESHRKYQQKARDSTSPRRSQDHPLRIHDLSLVTPLRLPEVDSKPNTPVFSEQTPPGNVHEFAQPRLARRSICDFTIQPPTKDADNIVTNVSHQTPYDPADSHFPGENKSLPLTPSNPGPPSLYELLMTGTTLRSPIVPRPRLPKRRHRELEEFKIQDGFNVTNTRPRSKYSDSKILRSDQESRSQSVEVIKTSHEKPKDETDIATPYSSVVAEELAGRLEENTKPTKPASMVRTTVAKDTIYNTGTRDSPCDLFSGIEIHPAESLLKNGSAAPHPELSEKQNGHIPTPSGTYTTTKFRKPSRRESQIHLPLKQLEYPPSSTCEMQVPPIISKKTSLRCLQTDDNQLLHQERIVPAIHPSQGSKQASRPVGAGLSKTRDKMDDFFDMRNHSPLQKTTQITFLGNGRPNPQSPQEGSPIGETGFKAANEPTPHPINQKAQRTDSLNSRSHSSLSYVDSSSQLKHGPSLIDALENEYETGLLVASKSGSRATESTHVSSQITSAVAAKVPSAQNTQLRVNNYLQYANLKPKGILGFQGQGGSCPDPYLSPTSDPTSNPTSDPAINPASDPASNPPVPFETGHGSDKSSSNGHIEYPILLNGGGPSKTANSFDVVRSQMAVFLRLQTGALEADTKFHMDAERRIFSHLSQLLELHEGIRDLQDQIESTNKTTAVLHAEVKDLQTANCATAEQLVEARREKSVVDRTLDKTRRRTSLLREMCGTPEPLSHNESRSLHVIEKASDEPDSIANAPSDLCEKLRHVNSQIEQTIYKI